MQEQGYNHSTETEDQKEARLYELRDEVTTGGDVAFRRLDEGGLNRILQRMDSQASWAIYTAYRDKYTKKENVQRNRDLRDELNQNRLGVHPLVGHWRECTLTQASGEPVPYDQCPQDRLKDVIERSYFIAKPDNWADQEFEDLMFHLADKWDQDSLVFVGNGKSGVYDPRTRQEYVAFEDSNPMVGEIAQAYSQYVKKINTPFMFEGIETPTALGYGLKAIHEAGFRWVSKEVR